MRQKKERWLVWKGLRAEAVFAERPGAATPRPPGGCLAPRPQFGNTTLQPRASTLPGETAESVLGKGRENKRRGDHATVPERKGGAGKIRAGNVSKGHRDN